MCQTKKNSERNCQQIRKIGWSWRGSVTLTFVIASILQVLIPLQVELTATKAKAALP